MIVDCYSHIWDSPEQLGRFAESLEREQSKPPVAGGVRTSISAGSGQHLIACQPVDASIVVGFKSKYLGAEIPNETISSYVKTHPEKLVGFAGIDPTDPVEAVEDMIRAQEELGLKGISISPAAQNIHPKNSKVEPVFEKAVSLRMPVLFHPGIRIARECVLEYAQPVLLDEVAREHKTLNMVIAHLGYPWVKETLVLLAKHNNIYSDVSWLLHRPWEAYQAVLSAYQYGVMDKLLFGSAFPHSTPAQCIETLYGINHLCAGTNLPTIPREALRGIVEREALELLGIEHSPATERFRSKQEMVEQELEEESI